MIDPIIYTTKPPMNEVPGGWDPECGVLIEGTHNPSANYIMQGAYIVDNFLSHADCDRIIDFMKHAPRMESVSVQGMAPGYNDEIGSNRTTMWNTSMAEGLWRLFQRYELDKQPMICHDKTATDWWQGGYHPGRFWDTIAVSPMMRYMKYSNGGQHYAHYDAGYIYPDDRYRSLKSIVIYLTTNKTGATRLIYDGQSHIPVNERNHTDWDHEVNEVDVLVSVKPVKGRIFVFDHRMCHDVSRYDGAEGDRIIIRGDLIFKINEK